MIIARTSLKHAIDRSRACERRAMPCLTQAGALTACCRYRSCNIENRSTAEGTESGRAIDIAGMLAELAESREQLNAHERLHEDVKDPFQHIGAEAPPMTTLSATLNHLACIHKQYRVVDAPERLIEMAASLVHPIRTTAGFSRRRSKGLPHIGPVIRPGQFDIGDTETACRPAERRKEVRHPGPAVAPFPGNNWPATLL